MTEGTTVPTTSLANLATTSEIVQKTAPEQEPATTPEVVQKTAPTVATQEKLKATQEATPKATTPTVATTGDKAVSRPKSKIQTLTFPALSGLVVEVSKVGGEYLVDCVSMGFLDDEYIQIQLNGIGISIPSISGQIGTRHLASLQAIPLAQFVETISSPKKWLDLCSKAFTEETKYPVGLRLDHWMEGLQYSTQTSSNAQRAVSSFYGPHSPAMYSGVLQCLQEFNLSSSNNILDLQDAELELLGNPETHNIEECTLHFFHSIGGSEHSALGQHSGPLGMTYTELSEMLANFAKCQQETQVQGTEDKPEFKLNSRLHEIALENNETDAEFASKIQRIVRKKIAECVTFDLFDSPTQPQSRRSPLFSIFLAKRKEILRHLGKLDPNSSEPGQVDKKMAAFRTKLAANATALLTLFQQQKTIEQGDAIIPELISGLYRAKPSAPANGESPIFRPDVLIKADFTTKNYLEGRKEADLKRTEEQCNNSKNSKAYRALLSLQTKTATPEEKKAILTKLSKLQKEVKSRKEAISTKELMQNMVNPEVVNPVSSIKQDIVDKVVSNKGSLIEQIVLIESLISETTHAIDRQVSGQKKLLLHHLNRDPQSAEAHLLGILQKVGKSVSSAFDKQKQEYLSQLQDIVSISELEDFERIKLLKEGKSAERHDEDGEKINETLRDSITKATQEGVGIEYTLRATEELLDHTKKKIAKQKEQSKKTAQEVEDVLQNFIKENPNISIPDTQKFPNLSDSMQRPQEADTLKLPTNAQQPEEDKADTAPQPSETKPEEPKATIAQASDDTQKHTSEIKTEEETPLVESSPVPQPAKHEIDIPQPVQTAGEEPEAEKAVIPLPHKQSQPSAEEEPKAREIVVPLPYKQSQPRTETANNPSSPKQKQPTAGSSPKAEKPTSTNPDANNQKSATPLGCPEFNKESATFQQNSRKFWEDMEKHARHPHSISTTTWEVGPITSTSGGGYSFSVNTSATSNPVVDQSGVKSGVADISQSSVESKPTPDSTHNTTERSVNSEDPSVTRTFDHKNIGDTRWTARIDTYSPRTSMVRKPEGTCNRTQSGYTLTIQSAPNTNQGVGR